MSDHQPSKIAPFIAALLVAVIGGYVLAYLHAGTLGTVAPGPGLVRTYRTQLLADLFTPPAIVESWIRGERVYVGHF